MNTLRVQVFDRSAVKLVSMMSLLKHFSSELYKGDYSKIKLVSPAKR